MFEDFFDQIDKELGPLNQFWFEELAARDDEGPDISKDEEEEDPAEALETSVVCAQMFSTPKIFKQHFQSPDSVCSEGSSHGVTNVLAAFPWTDSSPCLFGSAKDKTCGQPGNCFGLLDTPKTSLAHSAKQISKSLGAQINPDISWTSSLNTPSTLTPTVILPKTEDRLLSTNCLREKEAVFVRKLFPSLSKGSENTAAKTNETDKVEAVQTDVLDGKPVCSADVSLDESVLWKQTVPSAIEDGEVRSTVLSVLDGAEDVLSIFFSNRTSALRRVRSKDRNRKRNDLPQDVSSADKEAEETLKGDSHTVGEELKSSLRNKDRVQWTPLSLSESSLNEGFSSGLSLRNSPNPAGSAEPQGGAGSQSFVSGGERLWSNPDVHAEGSQGQRSLLDKSPAFTLNKKSRKFVYRIPRSDGSKTGNKHKAGPVGLDQTLTENPSEEKISGDPNESRFVSEESVNDQTTTKRFSTQLQDLDEGLEMTQLSKAFAEDFTQELTSGGLVDVRSDQNPLISSTAAKNIQKTSQGQPESEQKVEDSSSCDDNSVFAEVSVNSPNESTVVLPTFEISHDSGCPTTFSDLNGTMNSKDVFSGFKTASNRDISIPNEALMKARASLHEAVGESLITFHDVTPQRNHKSVSDGSRRTRSSLETSNLPKPAFKTCVSDAQSSSETLRSKSFKQNISNCFSPPSSKSDYKTGSKRNIPVSDVGLQKAKTPLEEKSEKNSKQTHQKPDFRRGVERQAVLNSPHRPGVDIGRDDGEENCPLTASQKADVTELCNLLEKADSQGDFTQFKPSTLGSERDWDPDILNGIDFDDSFNCDVEKVKTDASTVNNSVDNLCSTSKETRNGIVPLSKTVDGINLFSNKNQSHPFGFKTAEGKVISISETSLNKARHFFEELDRNASCNEKDIKADTEVSKPEKPRERSSVTSSANFSDCTDKEYVSHLQFHQDGNSSAKDLEVREKVAGTEQNCVDGKADVVGWNSDSHFGFSTARGQKLKVSKMALLQARKFFNDVDSFEASKTQEPFIHSPGRCDDSMSTTSPQKTNVSWRETSININQSGSETINQMSNVTDIPSFERQNFFQEQKCGNDAKEMFTNICPSESCQPLSVRGYGFQTASGRDVSVSAEALEKSKKIFKGCDENADCLKSATIEQKKDKLDVENIKQTNGFTTPSGTFSEMVLQKETKDVYKDSDLINGLCDKPNKKNNLCMNQRQGNGVYYCDKPSSDQQLPDRCKQKVKEHNKNIQSFLCRDPSEMFPLNSSGGFRTASGEKVSVSAEALQRAERVLCDSTDVFPSTHCPKKQIVENQTGASSPAGTCGGFSTAGGKKVDISTAALQRAKNLFKDCEGEGISTSHDVQHQGCRGFSTANGKHVTVSDKALNEVREGFVDSFSREPEMNSSGQHKSVSPETENKGFCTAGGRRLAVSASALQRAKTLFKDYEEENCALEELVSETVPPETGRSHAEGMIIKDESSRFDKKNYSFSTASGKGVSVSKFALEKATKLFSDCDTQQVSETDNQSQKSHADSHDGPPVMLDRCKDEQCSHPLSNKPFNKLAQLEMHCLDCTDTQQLYFEQEAMACTKALLEDDDLNEPSAQDLTQENVEHNRKRKRELDAINITDSCEPPLKRKLLSEFDETVSCAKPLGPVPLHNRPNGSHRDGCAFRYNVHLQSNVTGTNRNSVDHKSNDHEQHPAATASLQARRQSVFVPPFQKSKKNEMSDGQGASKVSGGFIPPLKKGNKDDTLESKPQIDSCTALENKMTNSTPDNHKVAQYCDEKNQHVGSKLESTTTSVSNAALQNAGSDDRVFMETERWQEILQLARDMQDMRLRKKKRQTVRPLPGSVYITKTSGVSREDLKEAVGHRCPVQFTLDELHLQGVHHKVLQINSENAESFRFNCDDFFKCDLLTQSGAVQLADGGWLVPDSRGTAGKEEFCRALCDTPGVDPKLISDAWVFNHYRWIVWKRACMERAFPDLMGGLCLTPEQVLLQLKFRYDVEVDHSRRSSLRRIMERDDTPAKTMVLCICAGAQHSEASDTKTESAVIWLTDGWYAIKALLDHPLSALLHKGRLRVGDKVVISGAELVGSSEACPPLEAPETLMLKISANSTRRARWDTKLGYYRDPRPFTLPLSSLFAAGGAVSCVDILVLRCYPTQWMEKKTNGVFIFRNNRAEDREARKHNISKQKSMELLIANIQAQFEKELKGQRRSQSKSRTFSRHELEVLQDGEELYEAMEYDPTLETHLSEKQMEAVSRFRCSLVERRQVELHERVQKAMKEAQEADGDHPDRDVTPVWKLSVVDAKDLQSNSVYTLSIWRPSADLYSILKEGGRYRVYHLATSEGKKRSGVAHIQLTASKKTQFQDIEVSPEWLHQHFSSRRCVNFRDLQNPQFAAPCGEVDIVGFIVSIVDRQGNCPVLHLVDEKFDLVSVRTFSSLEQLALEELVRPQALVALSNLQLRQLTGPVPCLYAGEQAIFSINPKESHLQEAMVHLKNFVQTYEEFFRIAEEKVSHLSSGTSGTFQSPRTPGVPNPKDNRGVTPQQKDRVFSPFTPVNKRTPVSTSTSESKDPKNMKRKRGLVYLSRIPSPPPLTPLKTKASPSVNKTFNPPRRSVTPKPSEKNPDLARTSTPPPAEEWVRDEELVMIDTQALLDGLKES